MDAEAGEAKKPRREFSALLDLTGGFHPSRGCPRVVWSRRVPPELREVLDIDDAQWHVLAQEVNEAIKDLYEYRRRDCAYKVRFGLRCCLLSCLLAGAAFVASTFDWHDRGRAIATAALFGLFVVLLCILGGIEKRNVGAFFDNLEEVGKRGLRIRLLGADEAYVDIRTPGARAKDRLAPPASYTLLSRLGLALLCVSLFVLLTVVVCSSYLHRMAGK